ncbi:hypothetical protein EHYA_06951 [Embleya hyalina]|uniref:Uncharacterized protein n=1 Tax=Embleya hyalina TaxID=516124 RepID=A0A401YX92_9ACTN|nr:hypothetical protein EHYA_06951 [Embleya hyalina]
MITWWLVLISRSSSDSATTGLGKRGYQSLGARSPVHSEVVQDQDIGSDQLAHALVPGAVRVAAGELGQDPAGLREADVRALADGEVAQGLGDVCLADTARYQRMSAVSHAFAKLVTVQLLQQQ